MNPEVERLFHEVADLEPQARHSYLDEHCTDPALRIQVEKLIEFDQGSEQFLLTPLSKVAARIDRAAPVERIGPYRIVECIGRGGMGAVYEGERLDGELTLRVAIKFVPIALRTGAIVERFRLERQILANLNHPNISHVLDAGTTADGSPYLVMELIDGKPIDDWCRKQRLNDRQIVALFLKVCSAVRHAHQNLVIHRDLKPGNILVTPEGEPKLLDFGIAKLMDEAHAHEQTSVRALTPDYASPEQKAGLPITTATDIYGLGCVLHQLLTGEPPRGGAIKPELKGDLCNILSRALQEEPERRYGTVQELAEDLQRYLDYKPVKATPDSWTYIARRFVRRNPLLSASLAALLISVIAGTTLSMYQAKRAERRFQEVRSLANAFLFRFEEQIRDIPGTTGARQYVVNTASTYLQRLAAESRGDPGLQLELAAAYRKVSEVQFSSTASSLGDAAGAMRSLEKAQALLEELGPSTASRDELAKVSIGIGDLQEQQGELEPALQSGRKAMALADAWLKAEPRNPAAMEIGAQAAILLGRTLRRLNHPDEARVAIERAVSIDRLALEQSPGSEDLNLRIASDLGWLGTQPAQTEAVNILQRLKAAHGSSARVDRGLMVGMSKLASMLQPPESLDYLQQAAAIARHRVAADRRDTRALMDLQAVLTRQGSALLEAKHLDDSAQAFKEAIAIARTLVKADPANREARLNLGITLSNAGQQQEARRLFLDLLKANPNDTKVLYPYAYNQAALVEAAPDRSELCREGMAQLSNQSELAARLTQLCENSTTRP